MSGTEVLARSLLVGLALGLPTYAIGMWYYYRRRAHRTVLGVVGFAAGCSAGLAAMAGVAPPALALGLAMLLGLVSAAMMLAVPGAQDAFRARFEARTEKSPGKGAE